MYYQFLIEDPSGAELVEQVMMKIKQDYPETEYNCKPFHGIGHFPKGSNVREIKTGQLLNDLTIYLRGFDRALQYMNAVIVVVVDNDDRDTGLFRQSLEELAAGMKTDRVFSIAVEELEAWLLGDESAVLSAYPDAKLQPLRNYKQDSICGTWEVLADVLYRGGSYKLKKDSMSYREIGKLKCEWARRIGKHLNLHGNQSPSFQSFIAEIEKRLEC